MPKIYRVLKDYDLPTSTPPANPLDAKIYRNDLVQAFQPPSGGYILVKKLFYNSTLPGLVPEDYLAKAKPGFYRLRTDAQGSKQGAIVQVTNVKGTYSHSTVQPYRAFRFDQDGLKSAFELC